MINMVWQEYNRYFKMRTTFFNSHITRLLTFPFYLILNKFDIHPNIISLISLLLTITGVFLFFVGQSIFGLISLQVAFGFDCLDGIFARKFGRGSIFGQFLDLFLDRIANLVIYLGLLWSQVYLGNVVLTIPNIVLFLIGFSLYLIYINTSQLKFLVYNSKTISEPKEFSFIRTLLLMPYQLIDNGLFLLLISISAITNNFISFVFIYGIYQIPFILVLVALAYRESRK